MGNALVRSVAFCTRWVVYLLGRPVRGIQRLSNWLCDRFPYQGDISLPNGAKFHVDSRDSAERRILFWGDFHPEVTTFLKQHIQTGHYCLDIGANVGFLTVMMAHWTGQTGRVAAFEPNPEIANHIHKSVSLNPFPQVQVVEQAVHDRQETLTFYIHGAAAKSSLLADHVPNPIKILNVPADTVDHFMTNAGWNRLDLVKMDTEGNDCRAILGSAETLKRFRPVLIFEYWFDTSPEFAEPAFQILQEANYHIQSLEGKPFDWRQRPSKDRHTDVVCLPK